LQQKLALVMSF